jgi:hypothetical protein
VDEQMNESKWMSLTILLGVNVYTDGVGILRQTKNRVELFVWVIQLCFTRVVICDFEIKRTGNAGIVLLLILAREYLHFNFQRDFSCVSFSDGRGWNSVPLSKRTSKETAI